LERRRCMKGGGIEATIVTIASDGVTIAPREN